MAEKRHKNAKKQRATLKDVALKAGVSTAAASLVLNDKPNRFTDETRETIRDAARELGYVPNQSARSLATQSSSLFALIIPDIENLFFASLAKHIEDECRKFGYSLLITDTSENAEEQTAAVRRMIQLGVDGIFIVPAYGSLNGDHVLEDELKNTDFPVIFIDRYPDVTGRGEYARWSALAYDHERGGRLAAQTLVQAGHKRIGVIGPVSGVSTSQASHNDSARFSGFADELESCGIVLDPALVRDGAYRDSSGFTQADAIIDGGATAVFCGNDLIALGFIRRAHERGLAIPDDISVIGYDDVMGSFGLDLALTTIRQDVGKLACVSAKRMMDLCRENNLDKRDGAVQPPVTLLEPAIAARGTVRKLS